MWTRQGLRRQRRQPFAAGTLLLQQFAGAPRHSGLAGVGPAHQRREHRRFELIKPAGVLAEEQLRCGGNAHDFAAQRHEIEIGLEDLRLAPARFELARHGDLLQLLCHAAARAAIGSARRVGIDQPSELHRHRRRAARARVPGNRPSTRPSTRRQRTPVDAAVLPELLVFALHDGQAQRGRELRQRQPGAAAHAGVNAHGLNRLAVTVKQLDVRRTMRGAQRGEIGQLGSARRD